MGQYAYNSEIDAIRDLYQRGYTTDFMFHNGGLRDTASGKAFRPDELMITEHHRFEGASNPDDESVVYAIESDTGVRGIVVDAFGPYADPALASLLHKIKLRDKH